MSAEVGRVYADRLQAGMERLANNPYPGRGIVLGRSAGGEESVMVYWVMGRSDNSRNRRLVQTGNRIRTEAIDPSKVKHPHLIIYDAMREVTASHPSHPRLHIVSNGDQTNTVVARALSPTSWDDENAEQSFRGALLQRTFEPDDPNYTPRITGALIPTSGQPNTRYLYSGIKRNPETGRPEYTFGNGTLEEDLWPGTGICFHTYQTDGNPLPSFEGSPYAVPLEATAEETAEAVWSVLNPQNRVALAVKALDTMSGEVSVHIINQQPISR